MYGRRRLRVACWHSAKLRESLVDPRSPVGVRGERGSGTALHRSVVLLRSSVPRISSGHNYYLTARYVRLIIVCIQDLGCSSRQSMLQLKPQPTYEQHIQTFPNSLGALERVGQMSLGRGCEVDWQLQ
jgi:hypothetical protein